VGGETPPAALFHRLEFRLLYQRLDHRRSELVGAL
jgi:hypothetical protein